jgi:hypothetical protein
LISGEKKIIISSPYLISLVIGWVHPKDISLNNYVRLLELDSFFSLVDRCSVKSDPNEKYQQVFNLFSSLVIPTIVQKDDLAIFYVSEQSYESFLNVRK